MQKTLKKTLISDRKIWDCYQKKNIKMKQSFIQGSNSIVCGKIA